MSTFHNLQFYYRHFSFFNATYANIFMAAVDKWLEGCAQFKDRDDFIKSFIIFLKQFIDDYLIFWTGSEDDFKLFMIKINSMHPTITSSYNIAERSTNFLDLSSSSIMQSECPSVWWGRIWVWDDWQAGPCMASVHGWCMGAWWGGDLICWGDFLWGGGVCCYRGDFAMTT